jgi:hypothetical protein
MLKYFPVIFFYLILSIIFRGLELIAQGLYNILKGKSFLGNKQLKV